MCGGYWKIGALPLVCGVIWFDEKGEHGHVKPHTCETLHLQTEQPSVLLNNKVVDLIYLLGFFLLRCSKHSLGVQKIVISKTLLQQNNTWVLFKAK